MLAESELVKCAFSFSPSPEAILLEAQVLLLLEVMMVRFMIPGGNPTANAIHVYK